MLEAEVKLAVDAASISRLRARLEELGATAAASLEQEDLYFAHPNRDFAQTDEALRLRVDAKGLRVTYKGPKLDPPRKTREEIEFPLGTELETARTLLERLGFRIVARVAKTRTEISLPGAIVSLDHVDGLGDFCEVEVEADSVDAGRTALSELCARLDLGDRPPIAESYLELLLRAGLA